MAAKTKVQSNYFYMLLFIGVFYLLGAVFGVLTKDRVTSSIMLVMAFMYFLSHIIVMRALKSESRHRQH